MKYLYKYSFREHDENKNKQTTTTASFLLSSLTKQPIFRDAITPRDITFEEGLKKFHTDDASLPRYGYYL